MKWFFRLLQCLLLLFALFLPAYAAQAEQPPPEGEDQTLTATTETEGNNITVNVTLPPSAVPEPESPAEPEVPYEPEAEWKVVPYATYELDTPAPSEPEASTLKDTLTTLFGPYIPRTQTVTERLEDGSSVTSTQAVPGLAGLDWPWLASVGLFALFLYSLLRMIGGMLK